MFRKKLDTEVLNLFNHIENKIDNINSKFDSITYLDGCCQCKKRETKINEMLITFLESKFSELKNEQPIDIDFESLLLSVKTELQNTLVSTADHKSSIEKLNNSINEIKLSTESIQSTLQNNREIPTDFVKDFKDSTKNIQDILTVTNENLNGQAVKDNKLRSDLNTFLVAIKDDLKTDIKQSMQITLQNNNDQIDSLKNTLNILTNKTDAIFYDNEIIKHQFSIEENIRNYSDTIDSLKTSIDKSINDINDIFIKFNFQ